MATIRAFTSLEQSKVLADILPLESADCYHAIDAGIVVVTPYITCCGEERCVPAYKGAVPCWSLAALLSVLPEYNLQRTDWGNKTEYKIVVTTDEDNYASKNYDNPLDACVDMIEKLHELKML